LVELLKEGHVRINKFCDNAVLLIGVTGEGKSTLCSAFGGHKLVSKWNEQLE
jgi:predicted GTPase